MREPISVLQKSATGGAVRQSWFFEGLPRWASVAWFGITLENLMEGLGFNLRACALLPGEAPERVQTEAGMVKEGVAHGVVVFKGIPVRLPRWELFAARRHDRQRLGAGCEKHWNSRPVACRRASTVTWFSATGGSARIVFI
jgi:hypothetical protein